MIFIFSEQGLLLIAPHVPNHVFKSIWFWVLLLLMIAGILLVYNFKHKLSNFKPKTKSLTYKNEGRGGQVIYNDSISSISFYFEFGGGNCVAIIFVPTIIEWEKVTKRSLSERNEIINFVARQALQDQVRDGSYTIKDNCIELMNKS